MLDILAFLSNKVYYMDMENLPQNINENQKSAILNTKGPMLVLAGAGSGKTLVITQKIAHLIRNEHVMPESIMAITFTNKSANEMRSRVLAILPDIKPYRLSIRTFHATCLRVLKDNYYAIGYKKDFIILDSSDSLGIIKKILKSKENIPKSFSAKFVSKYISYIKNSTTGELDTKNTYGEKKNETEIINNLYKEYIIYCKNENAMDFDDLIIKTLELFENNIEIRKHYKDMWQYILVDEFQDINISQYRFIELLTNPESNITIVGDDDQSIYRFRGAAIEHILDFPKKYKDTSIIRLGENYRCPKDVVSIAMKVIKNNKNRHEKDVFSNKENKYPVELWRCTTDLDEAYSIVEEIEKLFDEGFNAKDIVILFRMNSQSRIYEKELLSRSIPYKIIGGFRFFERAEVKDTMAFLRLITGIYDNTSFRRVINTPSRGIGDKSIAIIEDYAYENKLSLYETVHDIDIKLSKKMKERIKEFIIIIEDTREKFEQSSNNYEAYQQIFSSMLDSIDYYSIYKGEDEWKLISVKDNIKEVFNAFYDFTIINRDATIIEFLNEMTLSSGLDNNDMDAITLMTVHNAKGLEFDVVFLTGLETGVFPHYFSLEEEGGIEEERRLCYVGLTRAKTKLYVTYAKRRRSSLGIVENVVSPFVAEMPKSILLERVIGNAGYMEIDDDAFDY